MFRVDRNNNEIQPLPKRDFNELKIREREHLQEWLVKRPVALGEDLLIIQKEFAGFEGTKERLDLLALDKNGQIVVIENKLDDSGRDVVWQALKYVAYCSSLTRADIVGRYQDYLNDYGRGGEVAEKNLCDFLEIEELDEKVLNDGTRQRLMLVAANFRKEVTSTALWLIDNDIQVQCFQVTPYSFEDEIVINLHQIIPTPEAADYMIKARDKEVEAQSVKSGTRHKIRQEFWTRTLEAFKQKGIKRYENITPSTDHWLASATGLRGCSFNLIFSKKEARIDLCFQRKVEDENKFLYDRLWVEKDNIEREFGASLHWDRGDNKKKSQISCSRQFDGFNEENWSAMIDWLCENFALWEKVFLKRMDKLKHSLESQEDSSDDNIESMKL